MKLSFVIPAYNEEKYIHRVLESIFNQEDLEDYEVIVVDNDSTDNTVRIAKTRFPNVRVVEEKHKGTNRARQRGLKESRGEIVAFIDADSILPTYWSSKVIRIFEKSEKVVAVSGPYKYYNQTKFENFFVELYFLILIPMAQFVFCALLKKAGIIIIGNLVVRRDAMEEAGGFDASIEFYGDDTSTAKKLMKIGKVKFSRKIFIYTSPRRLRQEGLLLTFYHYMINFIWVAFFDKPFTQRHLDVR